MGQEKPRTRTAEVIGDFTTESDTVAGVLQDIRAAIGAGGAGSFGGTHPISAVDPTYRVVSDGTSPLQRLSPTTDGTLRGRIHLTNMLTGDTVDIAVEAESADGTWEQVVYSFSGAQTGAEYFDFEVEYFNGLGSRVMIRQTAGTARALVYRGVATSTS